MDIRYEIIPESIRRVAPRSLLRIGGTCIDFVLPPKPEALEERILRKYLHPGDAVVEAGGRVGGSTRLISNLVGKEGLIIAFEPNPRSFRVLQRNINGLRNTRIFNVAVSDREGTAFLSSSSFFDSAASIISSNKSRIPIKTVNLDRAIERFHIRKVDALIVDAEDAEFSIRTCLGIKQ